MDHQNGAWPDTSGHDPGALRASADNATMTEGTLILTSRTKLVLEILMVFMCVGAVTGNILVIMIVVATKTFHSVTSVLIINLAISDLLVGVGVMPFVAVSIMNSGWVNCADLCLYVGYTSSVYCTASVLTLAAIALDRYHSIVDCLRYGSRCTLWRTCAVVLWIWLQALVTSCPPLLGWSSVSYVGPMYSCAVNWADSPGYTVFMVSLSFLVPAAVILFCYVNIVKVARGHARRIHNLEDQLQRSRGTPDLPPSGDPNRRGSGHLHSPSRLVYHLSGKFVSEVRAEGDDGLSDPADPQSLAGPTSRRLFSFLVQSTSQPAHQNSQLHHHHGVVRLFLVIAVFFLCWTPYVGVVLVQATETALLGQSSLVSPTAITFSYWLVLLNSDINPLLYALLSKRFQGAMQSLNVKIRARLGLGMGMGAGLGGEVRAGVGDARSSEHTCTHTTHPSQCSSSSSSARDEAKYSVFTVNADFKQSKELHSKMFLHGTTSGLLWRDTGGDRMADCLQVPSRPQEGSRLPLSALTNERQATFFYGQITVRVDHDVC